MKLYIVQKYIWAKTPTEAIKKERYYQPDEVFIDNKWRENQDRQPDSIGYGIPKKKGKKSKPC